MRRTELLCKDGTKLDSTTGEYNLYVPHPSYDYVFGYRLAAPGNYGEYDMWMIYMDGLLCEGAIAGVGEYSNDQVAIRPIVSLPSNIPAELVDGVWTVSQ